LGNLSSAPEHYLAVQRDISRVVLSSGLSRRPDHDLSDVHSIRLIDRMRDRRGDRFWWHREGLARFFKVRSK